MRKNTRAVASEYLAWAKLHSPAKWNLATSGIMGYPLSALPVTMADLEINGPDSYGHEPLKERLARKAGVRPEQVMTTNGTSMANHLAMAAVLEPRDEVLIERPTYGLLLEVASYLGAEIVRFERRREDDFQPDIEEVRQKVTTKTRLIVLTNLHNPSGALLNETTLEAIGEIAAEVGARVLVDEVYLDMALDPGVRSSIHLGEQFLVTSSLTKSYGLSGVRCGWILAEAKLTQRIWRLNDLFNATPVYPGELISVIALDNLGKLAGRARALLLENRRALEAFLEDRNDLEVFRPAWGTVVFPRLRKGSVREFSEMLRREYDTAVVPGEYFEMSDHFRIGLGGDVAMTAEGLKRLGEALDGYGAGR